jgi:hypothetical protein
LCSLCVVCLHALRWRGGRDVGVVGARIGRRRTGTRRKPLAYRRFRDWQARRTESGDSCAYRFSTREHRQPANLQGKRPSEPAEMPTSCGTPVKRRGRNGRERKRGARVAPHVQGSGWDARGPDRPSIHIVPAGLGRSRGNGDAQGTRDAVEYAGRAAPRPRGGELNAGAAHIQRVGARS